MILQENEACGAVFALEGALCVQNILSILCISLSFTKCRLYTVYACKYVVLILHMQSCTKA